MAIPKLRQGSYFPDWLLQRRKRAERALTSVVATCYLLGVSTRRMEKLVDTLGITSLSKSQVSGMAKELDEQVEAFRSRPLDQGPYTFVAADALVLKVRENGLQIGWGLWLMTISSLVLLVTGVSAARRPGRSSGCGDNSDRDRHRPLPERSAVLDRHLRRGSVAARRGGTCRRRRTPRPPPHLSHTSGTQYAHHPGVIAQPTFLVAARPGAHHGAVQVRGDVIDQRAVLDLTPVCSVQRASNALNRVYTRNGCRRRGTRWLKSPATTVGIRGSNCAASCSI
ncbi:hypothetical protein Rruber_05433 (plasmid) [Rhodococcus ruber]